MSSRMLGYFLASTAMLVGVVYNAYQQRYQFYPTVIALTNSKLSVLVLCNEALVLTTFLGMLCKKLFFGTLREAEAEHLYEKSWYAITETCLAMTIFREEFDVRFVGLFTALLFIKIFHWLTQERIAFMEQTPSVRLSTHARMLLLMAILGTADLGFLYHALSLSVQRGPSVLLLFAFEYLILTSTVFSTFSKYALYINDMRLGGRWEDKGLVLFYLELLTDLFHMLVYLSFFVLICTYYGLPLHIMRDLYMTCRSFRARVADFVRYRRITHNMSERFPDATEEELDRTDRICIICREHLETAKKLRCGHMFHFHCLRSWFERQQSCPTCRAMPLSFRCVPFVVPARDLEKTHGVSPLISASGVGIRAKLTDKLWFDTRAQSSDVAPLRPSLLFVRTLKFPRGARMLLAATSFRLRDTASDILMKRRHPIGRQLPFTAPWRSRQHTALLRYASPCWLRLSSAALTEAGSQTCLLMSQPPIPKKIFSCGIQMFAFIAADHSKTLQ